MSAIFSLTAHTPRPYLLRDATPVLLALWLICAGPLAAAAAEDRPEFVELGQQIRQEYHSGNVVGAIALIDSALDGPIYPADSPHFRLLLTWKLEICELIQDGNCIYSESRRLSETPVTPGAEQLMNAQNAYYILSNIRLAADRDKWLAIFPQKEFWAQPILLSNPPLYIKINLLEALYHHWQDNAAGARIATDRALTALVSLQGIDAATTASLIREALDVLTSLGDSRRALDLLTVSRVFLEAQSANSIPTRYALNMTMADVYMDAASYEPASGQVNRASEMMLRLSLPERLQRYWARQTELKRIALCVAKDDTNCVTELAQSLEWPTDPDRYTASGYLKYTDDYLAVAAKVIGAAMHREPVNEKWLELLAHTDGFSSSASNAALMASYGHLARATYGSIFETLDARLDEFVAATSARIDFFSEKLRKAGDGLALPDLLSRVIFRITASALATQPGSHETYADVIFQLTEIENRSITHLDSDALATLASARSIDERRAIHSRQRLAANRFAHEREQLSKLVKNLQGASNISPVRPGVNWALYSALAGLKIEEIHLDAQLSSVPDFNQHHLPSVDALRTMLRPDEAFLTVTSGTDGLLVLCVTDDDFQLRPIPAAVKKIDIDKKLLMLSLTATHAPNLTLDRQFPAAASYRLFKAIFETVNSCAAQKSHWIWAPGSRLQGMPLGPLLTALPDGSDAGYDLQNAAWLGREHAISTVVSAKAFIALRHLSRHRQPAWRFLGIGDPDLSGTTVAGLPQGEALVTRALATRDGSLTTLSELPETADELRAIRAKTGEPATLLMRDEASERYFRRQPLAEFQALDFATHGLLRGDIDGLTDAALVLTPEDLSDDWNDGLLTANEVADLDLNASVIGLSACNSANFDWQAIAGEMPALTTAFAFAGATTTVATLWPVESLTSKEVMSSLIGEINSSGHRIGAAYALKQALDQFLADLPTPMHAHPRFWAPFIVYGDGGAPPPPVSLLPEQAAKLAHYATWDTEGGGEVTHTQPDQQSSGFFVTGYDTRQDNGRYQSFVARLDQKGKAVWAFRDGAVGNTSTLLQLPDSLLVAGYVNTEAGVLTTVIYALTYDGALIWKKVLKDVAGTNFPIGITSLPNKDIVLLLATNHGSVGAPITSLSAISLTAEGTILSQIDHLLPDTEKWSSPQFMLSGEKVYIAVSGNPSFESAGKPDLMGRPDTCYKSGRQLLIQYDLDQQRFVDINQYPGIALKSVLATKDGKTLFSANRQVDCAAHRIAATIAMLDLHGKLQTLYVDDGPFPTAAEAILQKADGTIWLIGTTTRPLDARLGAISASNITLENIQQVEGYERGEGFIQPFALDEEPTDRIWLTTGSYLSVNDATFSGDNLLLGGTSDWQAMWAIYR